jgi:hypothetical protein
MKFQIKHWRVSFHRQPIGLVDGWNVEGGLRFAGQQNLFLLNHYNINPSFTGSLIPFLLRGRWLILKE